MASRSPNHAAMSAKRALSPGGITERNLKTDTSPEKGREASHETKKAKRRKIPKTPTRSYPKQTPPPTTYDTGDVGSVKIPEAPLAKHQPSLLGLPVELLLQILVQLEPLDILPATTVSRYFSGIAIEVLYRRPKITLSESTLCGSPEGDQTVFKNISAFTKDLTLVMENSKEANALFLQLIGSLHSNVLNSITFEDTKKYVNKTDVKVRSSFSVENTRMFASALNTSFSTLQYIRFPECFTQDVVQANKEPGLTEKLWLLDSDIRLEFKPNITKVHNLVVMEAHGNLQTCDRRARGTCTLAIEQFLKIHGVGKKLQRFCTSGTHLADDSREHHNTLQLLDIASPERPIDVISLSLAHYIHGWFPRQLFESIKLSSIEELQMTHCDGLEHAFRHFIDCRDELRIKNLEIKVYDHLETLEATELAKDVCIETLLKKFHTLEKLSLRLNLPRHERELDLDVLKSHTQLRECDIDIPATIDPGQLAKLRANHIHLHTLGYRDDFINIPVRVGKWHKDFIDHFSLMAAELVCFPALRTLKISFEPVKPGKMRFKDHNGETNVYNLLAAKLHEILEKAAGSRDLQCMVDTIVLRVQNHWLYCHRSGAVDIPEDLVYHF